MLFSFLNAFLFLGFKGNPGVSVWPNASVHWWSHTTAPACLLPRGIPPKWDALYPVQSTGEHLSGFARSSSRPLFIPIRRNCSRTIFNWHCWGMLHSHTQLTSAAHWVHTKVWNITDTILSILQPLDVLAVRLLLERIAPKPLTAQNKVEFWNIQNLRNIYIKKLRECQTTVDGILRNSPCDTVCDRTSLRWALSL